MSQRLTPLWQNRSSLFFKLLISFMCVIVLLLSFNLLTYAFFRNSIESEIIKNSSLNLSSNVSTVEKNFENIKNYGFTRYFSSKTSALLELRSGLNYEIVAQIRRDLQTDLTNSFLYLNNIIYYFRNHGFIIEKEGSSQAERMFGHYYVNEQFTKAFWDEELGKPQTVRIYPMAAFYENIVGTSHLKGQFMPILIKHSIRSDLGIIAMLDINSFVATFRPAGSAFSLYIADADNQLLYASPAAPQLELPSLTNDQGHIVEDDHYLFYAKSRASGLTYYQYVPTQHIRTQLSKLSFALFGLLVVSVVIGTGASVFFSMQFNNPLRRIIDSIHNMDFSQPPKSSIREYALIGDQLTRLLTKNKQYSQDISHKNSLLSYYAYMERLKKIRPGHDDVKIPFDGHKPFRLVLLQLSFLSDRMSAQAELGEERSTYYIREYISSHFAKTFPESLTLQIEQDQILQLLFLDEEPRPSDEDEALQEVIRLKEVLDLDEAFCLFTFALSPAYSDSAQFGAAYELVRELVKQRSLGTSTQIITAVRQPPHDCGFSSAEEQEFGVHLTAGNETETVQLIRKVLAAMERKDALAAQFAEFAGDVLSRVGKMLLAAGLPEAMREITQAGRANLAGSFTREKYQEALEEAICAATQAVQAKRSASHPIVDFVVGYVEEHYGEDLSLDQLADKLNITGAYLSTYFKEKRGENLSEFITVVRMNNAMKLLVESDLKIQDIAERVGYCNVNSFIRVFKKHTGYPPNEYRKRRQNRP